MSSFANQAVRQSAITQQKILNAKLAVEFTLLLKRCFYRQPIQLLQFCSPLLLVVLGTDFENCLLASTQFGWLSNDTAAQR